MAADLIKGLAGGSDIYGSKPKIPNYPEPVKEIEKVVKEESRIFPDISKLAEQANLFTEKQLRDMYERMFPGMFDQINATLGSELKGEIPKDVQEAIQRGTAFQSARGGFGGSEMGRNLTARDLGLTSLDITNRALDSASRWVLSSRAPQFDVTQMFLNPGQIMQAADARFQRDLLKASVAAAPDPTKRGRFDSEMSILGMFLSAYGGGAGYTGQYRPNYMGTGQNAGGGGGGGGGSMFSNNFNPSGVSGSTSGGWGYGGGGQSGAPTEMLA